MVGAEPINLVRPRPRQEYVRIAREDVWRNEEPALIAAASQPSLAHNSQRVVRAQGEAAGREDIQGFFEDDVRVAERPVEDLIAKRHQIHTPTEAIDMKLCLETLRAVTYGAKIEGGSVGGECGKELDPKHIAQEK